MHGAEVFEKGFRALLQGGAQRRGGTSTVAFRELPLADIEIGLAQLILVSFGIGVRGAAQHRRGCTFAEIERDDRGRPLRGVELDGVGGEFVPAVGAAAGTGEK